jgi:hypothetical protein
MWCRGSFPLVLVRALEHVGDADGSKSKPLADQITTPRTGRGGPVVRVAAGSGWCGRWAWCRWPRACWQVLAALLWMGRLFARRLQGFTGDCLGATQQVCEIAFYFGVGRRPVMRLWLVRHAAPLVEAGTCYGALDVPADAQATQQAAQALAQALPPGAVLRSSTAATLRPTGHGAVRPARRPVACHRPSAA